MKRTFKKIMAVAGLMVSLTATPVFAGTSGAGTSASASIDYSIYGDYDILYKTEEQIIEWAAYNEYQVTVKNLDANSHYVIVRYGQHIDGYGKDGDALTDAILKSAGSGIADSIKSSNGEGVKKTAKEAAKKGLLGGLIGGIKEAVYQEVMSYSPDSYYTTEDYYVFRNDWEYPQYPVFMRQYVPTKAGNMEAKFKNCFNYNDQVKAYYMQVEGNTLYLATPTVVTDKNTGLDLYKTDIIPSDCIEIRNKMNNMFL